MLLRWKLWTALSVCVSCKSKTTIFSKTEEQKFVRCAQISALFALGRYRPIRAALPLKVENVRQTNIQRFAKDLQINVRYESFAVANADYLTV